MSFAGHFFDMIRRDKQNREMRNSYRRRERDKDKPFIVGKYENNPQATFDELEERDKRFKEKKDRDERYTFIMYLSFWGGFVVATLIGVLLFHLIKSCTL